jgi:NAD(P)H dehydrogenase (quinone)
MRVLIVYAHPEPNSFNGAMKDVAVETLSGLGHEVEVSDLYAMDFAAGTTRRDFTTVANPDYLKYQAEERHALEHDGFAADVAGEIARLDAADLLIFQFPIYWFGMPALLKGWVDRVFAMGWAYGHGRWFNNGAFRGKRAMVAMSAGAHAGFFAPDGRYGDMGMILWPIHNGIFRFTGFDVLPPYVAYGVSRVDDAARAEMLAAYRRHLETLDERPPLAFNDLDDFDESGRLKPGIASKAAFIRDRLGD